MQTEFSFTLPRGYMDRNGTVHREGTMRLATALDELAPLRDLRVKGNPGYLIIILLSRVITQLGSLSRLTPNIIEEMFAQDLAFLQAFYRSINEGQHPVVATECPACSHAYQLEVDLSQLGE
jgi:hypothetical protein